MMDDGPESIFVEKVELREWWCGANETMKAKWGILV